MNRICIIFFYVSIISACIVVSCKNDVNPNKNYGVLANEIEFVKYDSIVFSIDNLSLPYNNTIQYFEDSVKKYFTYLNSYNRSIYFFDYQDKKKDFVWNKVPYDHLFDSYFITNKDSIFLFNTKNKVLYLYNLAGTFKAKFNLAHEMTTDSTILPFPYINTSLPLVVNDSNLYITGYHVGEFEGENKKRKTVHKYDIQNEQLSLMINYPDLYNKFNWGITYYYMTSSTYNPRNHSLIVNFPLSHDLYIYNLVNEKGVYKFSASNYIESIEPFSNDKSDFIDPGARLKYYLENASYVSVYYDIYKNVYYRIAALPMHGEDIRDRDHWQKRQYKLIVMDDNFDYKGEIDLEGILPENVFITDTGLHIQVFSNDSEMKFKIINVEV